MTKLPICGETPGTLKTFQTWKSNYHLHINWFIIVSNFLMFFYGICDKTWTLTCSREKNRKNFFMNTIDLYAMSWQRKYKTTVCPRSSDPFYVVTSDIKWDITSWTYSTIAYFPIFPDVVRREWSKLRQTSATVWAGTLLQTLQWVMTSNLSCTIALKGDLNLIKHKQKFLCLLILFEYEVEIRFFALILIILEKNNPL